MLTVFVKIQNKATFLVFADHLSSTSKALKIMNNALSMIMYRPGLTPVILKQLISLKHVAHSRHLYMIPAPWLPHAPEKLEWIKSRRHIFLKV